jgi:hypothetical protein
MLPEFQAVSLVLSGVVCFGEFAPQFIIVFNSNAMVFRNPTIQIAAHC